MIPKQAERWYWRVKCSQPIVHTEFYRGFRICVREIPYGEADPWYEWEIWKGKDRYYDPTCMKDVLWSASYARDDCDGLVMAVQEKSRCWRLRWEFKQKRRRKRPGKDVFRWGDMSWYTRFKINRGADA